MLGELLALTAACEFDAMVTGNRALGCVPATKERVARTDPVTSDGVLNLADSQWRLRTDSGQREVDIAANQAMRLPAQRHAGENIGRSTTHTIFIELKEDAAGIVDGGIPQRETLSPTISAIPAKSTTACRSGRPCPRRPG